MLESPQKSVTLWGLLIGATAVVIPAILKIDPTTVQRVYDMLAVLFTGFFTYRGAKMVQNGNGKTSGE